MAFCPGKCVKPGGKRLRVGQPAYVRLGDNQGVSKGNMRDIAVSEGKPAKSE
jgi:hypothetical protein